MSAEEGQLVAGRYRLLERIGRGGMGTVWRAEDELLGRQVAVKRLHASPHLADDELATLYERTRREARSAARISHPNVVVVHDVVDDGGRPCVVMEYVPSRTLGDVIKEQGPVTPQEAARIGRGMVAALRAAHAAGVLHRDVKPGNVLLGDDGRVVLTDFGIAVATGASTLTKTGEMVGSIDYVAPERVRGGKPGPASDLWSLGATLYQAVEGSPPFRRATALETAYAIAADELTPPRRAGALTPLIEALLVKDPEQRPSAEAAERSLRQPDTVATAEAATGGRTGSAPAGVTSDAPTRPRVATAVLPAEAAPQDDGGQRRTRPGRARRVTVWAAALAVLAGAAVAGATALRGNGDAGGSERSAAGKPAASGSALASPAPPPLPDGYHLVEEKELGVSFPVPDGWTRTLPSGAEERNEIAYVSPSGLVGIRISVRDFAGPDPLQHWKDDEAASVQEGKLPDYRKLRMQSTSFRELPAAIWEFTWQGSAREWRASALAFGRSGGKEHVIYLSAPKAEWQRHKHVFSDIMGGYRLPAPEQDG
ncbi:serine/threonine-protein kinase [Streptomyces sp. HNM0663]|uniref:non-specific serine/threonine protein kinase n=1 Tax=Streptomyces chengmaiensis TaxID=3040919 RepID=A0ABT6HU63_9ACTN|nr:serine/threonine-protein kinase [Streptomyces chengmaiensis]MDH2391803.1 serine/threonine-protein kinase [Streptomyces chengmaiensis]